MRFPVYTHVCAVGIYHHHRIEPAAAAFLEETDRKYHVQFFCQLGEPFKHRIPLCRSGNGKIVIIHYLCEILRLKKLLYEYDVRSLRSRLPYELLGICYIDPGICAACHLRCRHRHFSHQPAPLRYIFHL